MKKKKPEVRGEYYCLKCNNKWKEYWTKPKNLNSVPCPKCNDTLNVYRKDFIPITKKCFEERLKSEKKYDSKYGCFSTYKEEDLYSS